MWTGGIIIILVITLSSFLGLYVDSMECSNKNFTNVQFENLNSATITNNETFQRIQCNNIQSNLFLSYLVLIIGIAMLVAGFITR